jgi:hypothetical protein
MQDTQKTMSHYLQEMQKLGYVYDTIHLPHDAESKNIASNGRSIDDIVRAAGYKTNILPRVPVARFYQCSTNYILVMLFR